MPAELETAPAAAAAAPAAAEAAQSAPAADIGGASGGGIAGMMAALDRAAAGGGKPASKPADAPAAAAAAAAKPAEAAKPAPAPTKPEAAKPTAPEDAEPDWSKAPPKWHKIYEEHKAKHSTAVKTLEAKIKALESKPFEQAGDAKKLEALEKQLEELRGESTRYKTELVKRDYTQSDEYKTQFVDRAQAIYTEGVSFAEKLQVGRRNEDGEWVAERQGTRADFDKIRVAHPEMRDELAEQMFGRRAGAVLRYIDKLDDLSRDARLAVERHAQDHEKIKSEQEAMSKKEQQEFDSHFQNALEGIREHPEYGKWFKEDESDPEASEVLRDGFQEIEDILQKAASLPLDERAAYAAVFRSRAAAFPRALMEITRMSNELKALKDELAKYRGTDPGNANRTGEVAPGQAKPPVGIAGAAAAFDQMPQD